MFNLIVNVKNREVVSNISLEEFVDSMINPSDVVRKIVDRARSLKKGSKLYDKVKQNLPSFVPTYNHEGYVKTSTIKNPTGFIYIDEDEQSNVNPSDFPFVVAKWKSLSGTGNGWLVAVDLDKDRVNVKYLKSVVGQIANTMGINADLDAVSVDRLNIIGYDEEIYYNANYSKYQLEEDSTLEILSEVKEDLKKGKSSRNKKCPQETKSNIYQLLEVNEHFFSDKIRYTNFEDMIKEYKFENGEVVKDLKKDKVHFLEVYIPSKIFNGNRNSAMYKYGSAIHVLNPNLGEKRFYNFLHKMNNSICEEPLSKEEINAMAANILNNTKGAFTNKSRRFLFNPDYDLTGKERKKLSGYLGRKATEEDNTALILEVVENWDWRKDGRASMKAVMTKTGLSYSSIRRRRDLIKPTMEEKNRIMLENKAKKVA